MMQFHLFLDSFLQQMEILMSVQPYMLMIP